MEEHGVDVATITHFHHSGATDRLNPVVSMPCAKVLYRVQSIIVSGATYMIDLTTSCFNMSLGAVR